MNWKQIIILIIAFAVLALMAWRNLPIEAPGIFIKAIVLFVKLSVIIALAIFAYILAADKKRSS